MTENTASLVSHRKRPPIGRSHLLLVMLLLVMLGGVNFVLLKVMYTAYGDRRSFFVNQAINLLYIVYGGLILYPRMCFTSYVTPEMYKFPKRHFVIMGILDSLGTLFTCLGTAYTPGSVTPLLNQLLIPSTLLVSSFYLRTRYAWVEVTGAALIVLGAVVSLAPQLVLPITSEIRWYAVLFYAMSNLPMASSSCYKESKFDDNVMDVWYLTQWVSVIQFLVSFLYMPLLVLPGFSSPNGMTMYEVVDAFQDGWLCYRQLLPECSENGTFWLLTGYCGVNICFNVLGLYLTKHGSAVLNALSYSILLPFTTILFFTPMLGKYQEPLSAGSVFTFVGLSVSLIGFAVYQAYSRNVSTSPLTDKLLEKELIQDEVCCTVVCPVLLAEPGVTVRQPAFHERLMGVNEARLIDSRDLA